MRLKMHFDCAPVDIDGAAPLILTVYSGLRVMARPAMSEAVLSGARGQMLRAVAPNKV